jgi:multimeric flavodoxin WrbA
MQPEPVCLQEVRIPAPGHDLLLSLYREDYSAVYPGMIRYVLCARSGDEKQEVFRTNTYEYPPRDPLRAEIVARDRFEIVKQELKTAPATIFHSSEPTERRPDIASGTNLVAIEGSPRADGNCSVLTEWAVEAARVAGKTAQVIYPHDMEIHPCIGCYQCYNTGTCTFADDMTKIIDALRGCSVLAVSTPVYTNTVPGSLKTLIDRCQAYHAERTLFGGPAGQQGVLFVVAGRKGKENFTCVTRVVRAFFRNLGFAPDGQLLIDGTDEIRDIRKIAGLREQTVEIMRAAFGKRP